MPDFYDDEHEESRIECTNCHADVPWESIEFVNNNSEIDMKYGVPICHDCIVNLDIQIDFRYLN